MAELITLATFDFDTDRLEKSLGELQSRLFKLKKEQEGYTNLMKEQQKAATALLKENLKLADSGEEMSEAYQKNERAIEELNAAQEQNFKNSQNVANNMRAVRTEINQTEKQLRSYMNDLGDFTTLQNKANQAIESEIRNKNDALAANIKLQQVSNQLNPAIAEEAELLRRVNDQIDQNTEFIKDNSSAIAKQKMNVGNYTESIREALDNLNPFNGGLTGFIERSREAGGVAPMLTSSFSAITSGIGAATKAGLAFIATPIGAAIAALAATIAVAVGAFKLMQASMQRTEDGTNRLRHATAATTGIYNAFFESIKPVGEFLGEAFVLYVDRALKSITQFGAGTALILKKLGFDSAAESVAKFTVNMEQGVKKAQELSDAEAQLTKMQRDAQRVQLEYQTTAERLRQIRDDESKSIGERIAANNQLGKVLKEQAQAELVIANQALKVADLRIKSEGANTEALDQRAEALTRIVDIQERITGQESEQLVNLNSLRKEAAEQQIAQMEQFNRSFALSQGIRKKELTDQLDFERQMYERSLAVEQKRLDTGLIKRAEYEANVLQIQSEYAAKQRDLILVNADEELALFIETNQRRITNAQLVNDSIYQIEVNRLNSVSEAEAANATARYEQGAITYQEYVNRIAEIDRVYAENKKALDDERFAAQQAQQAADIALQIEAQGENFEYNLQLQQEQEDIRFAQQMANVQREQEAMAEIQTEQYEKGLIDAETYQARINEIDAKYNAQSELQEKIHANNRKKIEETVQANKVQLASDAFGQLAAIAGEESAAGKAFAIAQTIIDTYSSATSAFNSLSGIPIVGPVLGGIAAAAAVASGLANVKKITAVKTPTVSESARPSYALGGPIDGAGTGTSDSIPINASNGEFIMTARARQMFPSTISTMNQLSGGRGLDEQLTSTIMQGRFQDNAQGVSTEAIAEAVAIGAEAGTKRGATDGMTGLAENRKIMQDATF